jgi:hypothetical protein
MISGGEFSLIQKTLEIDTCYFTFPDLTIYAGTTIYYDLPSSLVDNTKLLFDIRLAELSKFTSYQRLTGRFTFEPEQKHASNTPYRVEVRIILKESMLLEATSVFKVRVEGNEKDPMSAKCPDQSKDKKCLPRIAGVSVNGELTIQFPFPIKTYKKDFYQNIT